MIGIDMEMPITCDKCLMLQDNNGRLSCYITSYVVNRETRHANCPFYELEKVYEGDKLECENVSEFNIQMKNSDDETGLLVGILGLEIPESCGTCEFELDEVDSNYGLCSHTYERIYDNTKRLTSCPMVKVHGKEWFKKKDGVSDTETEHSCPSCDTLDHAIESARGFEIDSDCTEFCSTCDFGNHADNTCCISKRTLRRRLEWMSNCGILRQVTTELEKLTANSSNSNETLSGTSESNLDSVTEDFSHYEKKSEYGENNKAQGKPNDSKLSDIKLNGWYERTLRKDMLFRQAIEEILLKHEPKEFLDYVHTRQRYEFLLETLDTKRR